MEYLITDVMRKHPHDVCPVCKHRALPENPEHIVTDEADDFFVERMYCRHLYHHGCLGTSINCLNQCILRTEDRSKLIPVVAGGSLNEIYCLLFLQIPI